MKLNDTFRDYSGSKCHIRGFVDDMVVYRYWSKHKQKWIYKIEPKFIVERIIEVDNDNEK